MDTLKLKTAALHNEHMTSLLEHAFLKVAKCAQSLAILYHAAFSFKQIWPRISIRVAFGNMVLTLISIYMLLEAISISPSKSNQMSKSHQ